ncbi:Serine/threonine-protein kinase ppk5 [Diplonema papillatum]|nr:Serine/threonine-protein kinase ppk5 [Diplonema papillatum]
MPVSYQELSERLLLWDGLARELEDGVAEARRDDADLDPLQYAADRYGVTVASEERGLRLPDRARVVLLKTCAYDSCKAPRIPPSARCALLRARLKQTGGAALHAAASRRRASYIGRLVRHNPEDRLGVVASRACGGSVAVFFARTFSDPAADEPASPQPPRSPSSPRGAARKRSHKTIEQCRLRDLELVRVAPRMLTRGFGSFSSPRLPVESPRSCIRGMSPEKTSALLRVSFADEGPETFDEAETLRHAWQRHLYEVTLKKIRELPTLGAPVVRIVGRKQPAAKPGGGAEHESFSLADLARLAAKTPYPVRTLFALPAHLCARPAYDAFFGVSGPAEDPAPEPGAAKADKSSAPELAASKEAPADGKNSAPELAASKAASAAGKKSAPESKAAPAAGKNSAPELPVPKAATAAAGKKSVPELVVSKAAPAAAGKKSAPEPSAAKAGNNSAPAAAKAAPAAGNPQAAAAAAAAPPAAMVPSLSLPLSALRKKSAPGPAAPRAATTAGSPPAAVPPPSLSLSVPPQGDASAEAGTPLSDTDVVRCFTPKNKTLCLTPLTPVPSSPRGFPAADPPAKTLRRLSQGEGNRDVTFQDFRSLLHQIHVEAAALAIQAVFRGFAVRKRREEERRQEKERQNASRKAAKEARRDRDRSPRRPSLRVDRADRAEAGPPLVSLEDMPDHHSGNPLSVDSCARPLTPRVAGGAAASRALRKIDDRTGGALRADRAESGTFDAPAAPAAAADRLAGSRRGSPAPNRGASPSSNPGVRRSLTRIPLDSLEARLTAIAPRRAPSPGGYAGSPVSTTLVAPLDSPSSSRTHRAPSRVNVHAMSAGSSQRTCTPRASSRENRAAARSTSPRPLSRGGTPNTSRNSRQSPSATPSTTPHASPLSPQSLNLSKQPPRISTRPGTPRSSLNLTKPAPPKNGGPSTSAKQASPGPAQKGTKRTASPLVKRKRSGRESEGLAAGSRPSSSSLSQSGPTSAGGAKRTFSFDANPSPGCLQLSPRTSTEAAFHAVKPPLSLAGRAPHRAPFASGDPANGAKTPRAAPPRGKPPGKKAAKRAGDVTRALSFEKSASSSSKASEATNAKADDCPSPPARHQTVPEQLNTSPVGSPWKDAGGGAGVTMGPYKLIATTEDGGCWLAMDETAKDDAGRSPFVLLEMKGLDYVETGERELTIGERLGLNEPGVSAVLKDMIPAVNDSSEDVVICVRSVTGGVPTPHQAKGHEEDLSRDIIISVVEQLLALFNDGLVCHGSLSRGSLRHRTPSAFLRQSMYSTLYPDLQPTHITSSFDDLRQVFICSLGASARLTEFKEQGLSPPTLYYPPSAAANRPPELFLKDEPSGNADAWSLSCLAFELLTGDTLFSPSSEAEHVEQIVELLGNPSPALVCGRMTDYFDAEGSFIHPQTTRWNMRESLERLIPANTLDFVQFVEAGLKWDPSARMSVGDALKHPWIQPYIAAHRALTARFR